MSNEIIAVGDSTAPSLANQFDIVDVEGAAAFMQNYQDLVKALLDKSDYQQINGVPKKKKSAWRKLATAFNISDDIVEKEIIREDDHQIVSAWFMVKATLPNGRSGIGVGDCSIFDKINKKDNVMPSNFELRKRFNNAEHDVLTTAHTRAKSRAISDLVGGGEVSAEELEGLNGKTTKPVKPSAPKPSKPKVPTSSNLGNKPKSPSAPKPKRDVVKEMPVDQIVAEAIEVEATEVKEPEEPKSFKEICDSNPALTMAVKELQANGMTVNHAFVHDKLLDLWDMGKITDEEIAEAKKLLE